ncbi:hypothetical protein MMC31_007657 [Peltigera leucophlebia]|nr:hypothetical protein [Peltigera leucophlebia]
MAPGSRPRCFPRGNPPPVDLAEDELAGGAPSRGSFPPPVSASISTEELIQLFWETYATSVKVLEQNQAVINEGKARETPTVPVKPEESKESKPPQHSKQPKPSEKKSRKEKKKQRRLEQARKQSIPALGANANSSRGKARKDLNHITCFKCGETGHYADKCHKPKKDTDEIQALIDSGSEVNAMAPAYAKKLGLRIRKTDVGAQKIDGSALETYGMVIAGFQVQDKLGRARFFQETFLVTDTSMEVVFGMPFLTLSNADVVLQKGNLLGGLIQLQRPCPPPRGSRSSIQRNLQKRH